MPEEIKFTEEEMKHLQKIQDAYIEIQNKFGQASITAIRLDNQYSELEKFREELEKQFEKNQDDERNFLKSVNEKYGEGVLDPKTGIFTKN